MIQNQTAEAVTDNEDKIQAKFWLEVWNRLPDARLNTFAVPNGGARDEMEAFKLMATGTLSGVPDMVFFWKNNKVLWIEFKDDEGTVRPTQKFFHQNLGIMGHEYMIARDWVTPFNRIKDIIEADPLNQEEKTAKLALLRERTEWKLKNKKKYR